MAQNYSVQQLARFNPEQQKLMGQVGQQIPELLSGLQANKPSFDPIEKRARSQFSQQTVPGIAERFSGMGAQGSSAFASQLGQAGSDLEERLAGMRSHFGLQQRGQDLQMLQQLLGAGLQPGFENLIVPGEQSFGESLGVSTAANLLPLVGSLLGSAYGPVGTAGGAAGGTLLSSLLGMLFGGNENKPAPFGQGPEKYFQ